MVSKRMNLNRNVASQARIMPLIKCCASSSGGLTAKTASVAKGIRQTASQRMMSGLGMVCNQFKIIGRGWLFMFDFPTLMDWTWCVMDKIRMMEKSKSAV